MSKQHKNNLASLPRELGKRKKIREAWIFSGHPLGRETSPTYVYALLLYIGNAQTTQKQNCPIAQLAWQKEKLKSARHGFSPATHWVVRQVLRTCMHLYCTLAMRKQHKTILPHCPGAWEKKKIKIRAARIFSGHPLGRETSPTYVYALVLYIGNAQTQKQRFSQGQLLYVPRTCQKITKNFFDLYPRYNKKFY